MRKLRNGNVAWICILCILHLMSMDYVSATTNPGYGGTTISGRPSIAVISGGASGLQVNTLLGNLYLPTADLAIPARGLPFEIKRAYNSVNHTTPGPFGIGWDFSYCLDYVRLANGNIIVAWGDGRTDLFVSKAGAYTPANEGVYATLEQYQTDQFRVTAKEGVQYYFDNPVHRHVTRIVDPNGNALTFTYDSNLELTSVTDGSGRSVFFSYTNGKVTTITDPNASPSRTLQYAYDANGNQVRFTDPLGNVTRYAYDNLHRLTRITDALGITTISYHLSDSTVETIRRTTSTGTLLSEKSFSFDHVTDTTSVRDLFSANRTAVTRYHYDSNQRLTSTVDPLGHTETRTYDAAGNIASTTDANGNTTKYTYDAQGNVLTQTNALGETTTLTYESTFNRITSVTDAESRTTTLTYDSNGNLISVQDPLNNTTQYNYDSFGQLQSRLDPRGFTTSFTYDANGDPTSQTDPLGHSTRFVYDEVGNVLSSTDAKLRTTTYSYDAYNRLTHVGYADATRATYTYDALGNRLSATDPNTDLTFAYDAASRLLQTTDLLQSQAISYDYDGVGNRTQMTDPQGTVTNYSYDAASRLTRMERAGEKFLYDYDNGNRRARLTLANGSRTTYRYDAGNELLSQVNAKSNGSILSIFTYQYDAVGNRTELNLVGGDQIVYGYDDRNQLTSEVRIGGASNYNHSFAYDSAGNRTQATADGVITSYAYDDGNQLTQETMGSTTTTYAYDANGNQIQKAVGASTSTSTYDVRDRLVGFSSPTTTSAYTYDALDRRIMKSVGGAQTRSSYDGLDAVAEYDGSGTLQAQNLFAPGIDENLARYTASGSLYYLHDGLNSVRTIVDAAQNVRNSYDYDAWGNILSQVATVVNDYTFTGRQVNQESGLYYCRTHLYDPLIGRFTQLIADVLGRSPFVYVGNNPVNRVAPLVAGGSNPVWDYLKVIFAVLLAGLIAIALFLGLETLIAFLAIILPIIGVIGAILVAILLAVCLPLGLAIVFLILLIVALAIAIYFAAKIAIIILAIIVIIVAIIVLYRIWQWWKTPAGGGAAVNPGGGNGANAPDRKGVDGGFAQANAGNRRDDTNLAGGGTFVGVANQKSVIAICSVSGLADSTAPTPTSLGSISNATDLSGSLEIYNFATRTQIDAVSFTSVQGSFANGAANLSITGTADVNGTLTNFSFSEAEAGGVITYEMQNSDTSAVLAAGTGEAGRSTFALRIGF